jgi:hypothetical protein
VVASICLALGTSGATPVRAEFGAPIAISKAGEDAFAPRAALDADGDAVIAWQRFDGTNDRIQARTLSAAGVLGTIETLSKSGQDAFDPQVSVDADGDAVVTWARLNDSIQARPFSAAGVPGSRETLSEAGEDASDPRIAIDADGDAVVAWMRSDGTNNRIELRSLSAAGGLGPIETLSKAGEDAFDPQVSIDADGDAVATWTRSDGANSRIQARTFSAAGVVGPRQTLSDAGEDAFNSAVASDDDGDTVIAWERFDGTNVRIEARTLSAAGVLGPVHILSDASRDAFDPHVAIDPDGDAVVTWWRFDGSHDRVEARAISAAGVLGAIKTISKAGQNALAPQVALDADGDAVIAWQRSDGANERIQARTLSAAGVLDSIETLSEAGEDAFDPRLAVDADGNAVVTWVRFDGTSHRIQAAATVQP